MLSRLRPSHTTLVAYLALFVALGGTSYAATKIGSKQIKDNSIKSKDLKNNDIQGKDVKNGSLTGGDFKAGQLPVATGGTGPRGLTGPPGPQGIPAPHPGAVSAVKPASGDRNCSTGKTGEFCAISPLGGQLSDNVAGFQPVGFYKDGWGFVHVQGSASIKATNAPVFVLPTGFRPSAKRRFIVTGNTSTGPPEGLYIEIDTDGSVNAYANRAYTSLEGIAFRP